jgi:hypothetical protein
MEAYCMKCKQLREVKNPVESTTSKGAKMLKGQCTVCSTNVCKILGKMK